MKKILIITIAVLAITIASCKKSSSTNTDVKNSFVGNWAGIQVFTGASTSYKFSLAINADNTVVNIDSAFGNQAYPGTYTYTADSLKINYNNGTKWSLKFLNNYSGCSGSVLGYSGATATVSMAKK